MLKPLSSPFLDLGLAAVAIVYGVIIMLVTFCAVVIVEAIILKSYYHLLPIRLRLRYSFILNALTTIVGLPFLNYFGNEAHPATVREFIWGTLMNHVYSSALPIIRFEIFSLNWMLIAWVLTVILEAVGLYFLVRPNFKKWETRNDVAWEDPSHLKWKVIAYSFTSNIASYAVLFLLPLIIYIITFKVGQLFSR